MIETMSWKSKLKGDYQSTMRIIFNYFNRCIFAIHVSCISAIAIFNILILTLLKHYLLSYYFISMYSWEWGKK